MNFEKTIKVHDSLISVLKKFFNKRNEIQGPM